MSIRITCITKAGGDHEIPYVFISRLGWETYSSLLKRTRVQETIKIIFQ